MSHPDILWEGLYRYAQAEPSADDVPDLVQALRAGGVMALLDVLKERSVLSPSSPPPASASPAERPDDVLAVLAHWRMYGVPLGEPTGQSYRSIRSHLDPGAPLSQFFSAEDLHMCQDLSVRLTAPVSPEAWSQLLISEGCTSFLGLGAEALEAASVLTWVVSLLRQEPECSVMQVSSPLVGLLASVVEGDTLWVPDPSRPGHLYTVTMQEDETLGRDQLVLGHYLSTSTLSTFVPPSPIRGDLLAERNYILSREVGLSPMSALERAYTHPPEAVGDPT